jgi:hypothetical protein
MSSSNQRRRLQFSDEFVEAYLVEDLQNFTVEDGIVINLDETPMIVGGDVPSIVPPWKSTTLHNGNIIAARRVVVVRARNTTNLGGLTLSSGWDWFGNRFAKFPRNAPLYISRYDEICDIEVNPLVFTNQSTTSDKTLPYRMRLNLWWSPTGTDCYMHNEHPFLEIHTQVYGCGRIQKFRERNEATLYEEITMAPGYTHDPFVRVNSSGLPEYPWHRYFSDSDAIWLAIELHPQATSSGV